MENFKLFVTFHKAFPFHADSSWQARAAYEPQLDLGGDYICTSEFAPNIAELLPGGEQVDPFRVGYLAQTIATEYWILHHLRDVRYVGVTGYRRYPLFAHDRCDVRPVIPARPTPENLQAIGSDAHIAVMESILAVHDVIVPRALTHPLSVRDQYLEEQLQSTWDLFIDCVAEVVPEHRHLLPWFDLTFTASFCGPMGMTPLGIFKEYADSYARIVSLMCQRAERPFVVVDPNARMKTDRWIGYLAERYYPFFLFANRLTTFQVPTVYLD